MNREEFATKVQALVNQAYLHDIDNKYYKGLMDEAEKLRYPITLAEFLGWEEGVAYRRGGNILKVDGNHLLDKRPNGKFHNTNCSTAELIDLRNATKYELKYYAKVKGWELMKYSESLYWNYYKKNDAVFMSSSENTDICKSILTKDEWNELGINDTNADFEEVVE